MVMTQSSPHVLQNVTDALTLVAFAFLLLRGLSASTAARRPTAPGTSA